ncbi:rod shape-determining protein MreD [Peribacillus sp. B-H-3]|uniref:rod shape-determining protein MreD n=1 Tax=Peribacillus sp. B-H-3 TaxID=3400420 RepID=UPI003B01851D
MKRFILPLAALVFFIFESLLANLFAGHVFGSEKIFVPRFILIFIAFLTIYGSRRTGMIYAFFMGLAYDVVYTEILGVYMYALPALAYLISKAMKVLQANLFITIFVTIFSVAVLEFVDYEINFLIHFTKMGFSEFVSVRLWPTLLLNLIFLILFSLPLKAMVEKLKLDEEIE